MEDASRPIRICALLGPRPGDNDQVIALAEALRLPFEVKKLEYNWLRILGPRLLGRSLASLTSSSRAAILDEAPPDLTISTGHRSVPVVRMLRHRSAGRTRSIHLGFPRISPGHFDLVIATPQYPIAEHSNLLRIPFALTLAAVRRPDPRGNAAIGHLPRPRQLLIVGGPTLFFDLDVPALRKALEQMLDEIGQSGSLVVTTSPRTPSEVQDMIRRTLSKTGASTMVTDWGELPSYALLLASADAIRVTADSVSMISDAIWTERPVAIIPIRKSPVGRILFALIDAIRPGVRLYPQDLRFFWRSLEDIGVGDQLALPRISTGDVKRAVLERAHALVAVSLNAASEGS